MKIDLTVSATNPVWAGCTVETVAGRANMTTPVTEALERVGTNVAALVAATSERREVTLTGPAPVWAYIAAFHQVAHSFTRVLYDDGKSGPVLVAAHGA